MSKNLVAFFSASGTTKKVAEMIAEEVFSFSLGSPYSVHGNYYNKALYHRS